MFYWQSSSYLLDTLKRFGHYSGRFGSPAFSGYPMNTPRDEIEIYEGANTWLVFCPFGFGEKLKAELAIAKIEDYKYLKEGSKLPGRNWEVVIEVDKDQDENIFNDCINRARGWRL